MYKVSEALDKVISGSGRTFYARLNGVQEGIQQIEQTTVSIPDDYIYIGGAFSSKIDVSVYTTSTTFKNGVEVKFEIGAFTGNAIEWIPMGYFTISESKKDRNLLKFTAYDRIGALLNTAYDCKVQTYPAESREFLNDISSQTGIEFDLSEVEGQFMIDEILSVDSESDNKVYKEPFAGFTKQQVVGYIAQLYGKFAMCDRNGKVVFKWYKKVDTQPSKNNMVDNASRTIKNSLYDSAIDQLDDGRIRTQLEEFLLDQDSFFIYDTLQYYASAQTYIVKTNRYFDDLVKDESKCEIKGIGCKTEAKYFTSGVSDDLVIENQVMTQEWIDDIWAKIGDVSFFPVSFSFMGDPRLDVGDVIAIIDANGNPVNVPVMKHVLKFDGGLLSKVSSHGLEEIEIKSPTSAALSRVKNDILTLKELTAKKITVKDADILYARLDKVNIDEGWITNAMIGDAQITNAKINDISADKITAGTITGLDALFNRSFEVNSAITDALKIVMKVDSDGFNVGIWDALNTKKQNISFGLNAMRIESEGYVRITGKAHLSLVSGENIVLYPSYTGGDGNVYINDGATNNVVLHSGNTSLTPTFSDGIEIGSLKSGNSSAILKVPLASNTQSGLITSEEKAKINTDYLQLTGGTIKSNNVNVLGLDCTSGVVSTLRFYGSGTRLGSLGFDGQNSKVYRWNASGTRYQLLDEEDLKDSGWVNVDVASGISIVSWAGARVRRIGNMVNVSMGVTGATAGYKVIGTLAAAYRPSKIVSVAARYGDSPDAQIAITPDGDIMIMARASGSSTYDASTAICFSTTYFV